MKLLTIILLALSVGGCERKEKVRVVNHGATRMDSIPTGQWVFVRNIYDSVFMYSKNETWTIYLKGDSITKPSGEPVYEGLLPHNKNDNK